MKILFLVDDFGKKMYANGICVQSLAEKFIEDGNSVTIICQKGFKEERIDEIDSIKIRRIKPRMTTRLLNASEEKKGESKKILQNTAFILHRIKKVFMLPLHPIISFLVIYRYYKLIKKENFDILISVLNPIEAVFAGTLYKKNNPNCYHLIYELDTITDNTQTGIKNTKYLRNRMIKTELFWYKYCDQIIHMNCHKSHYEQSIYSNFLNKTIYSDIPLLRFNFFEESKKSKYNNKKINIVYVGLLDKENRNPELFLELIKEQASILNREIVLDFAQRGNCDDIIQKYRNTKSMLVINDYGFIVKKRADELVKNADILLSIGNAKTINMIPSKTFEYISTGKPIIHLNLNDDISTKYLLNYEKSLILNKSDSKEVNLKKLEKFFSDFDNLAEISMNHIYDTYYMNLPEYTTRLITKKYMESNLCVNQK